MAAFVVGAFGASSFTRAADTGNALHALRRPPAALPAVPSRPRMATNLRGVSMVAVSPSTTSSVRAEALAMRTSIASMVLFDEFRKLPRRESFASLLCALLDAILQDEQVLALELYSRLWAVTGGASGRGWQGEIYSMVYNAGGGNPLSDLAQRRTTVPRRVLDVAAEDLRRLQGLHDTDPAVFVDWLDAPNLTPLPLRTDVDEVLPERLDRLVTAMRSSDDWGSLLPLVAEAYATVGTGLTGEYYGLLYANGSLLGVLSREEAMRSPMTRFIGVEAIMERLMRNTEFLTRRMNSQNALLYGPPGSGKSSMIRALVNMYGDQGLRVVEIAKHELAGLPALVATLKELPQSFIVFIDDLSYTEYETEAMRQGKAALEGSLRVASNNVAIYATSNRRHPAVSTIADETTEKLAFSHRFGLTLQFPSTTRQQYTTIVDELARDAGVNLPRGELHRRALLFAFGHHNPTDANGLSGRTARQFLDFLIADGQLKDAGYNNGSVDWGQAPGTPWYCFGTEDLESVQ